MLSNQWCFYVSIRCNDHTWHLLFSNITFEMSKTNDLVFVAWKPPVFTIKSLPGKKGFTILLDIQPAVELKKRCWRWDSSCWNAECCFRSCAAWQVVNSQLMLQTCWVKPIWINWRTIVGIKCVEFSIVPKKYFSIFVQPNCINIFENIRISIKALYKVQGVLNVYRFTFKTEFWLNHLVEIDVL